ncbi:unnamed protein product, partial [Ectocarpus sp. 13 AM-2016]
MMRVQREERKPSSTLRHQPRAREPETGEHKVDECLTRGMMRTHASLEQVSAAAHEAGAKGGSRGAPTSHSQVHSRDKRMSLASSGFESDCMLTARGAESDTMITARDMHTSRTDDYLSAVKRNTCRSTSTLFEDGHIARPTNAPAYGLPAYQFDGRTALKFGEQSSRGTNECNREITRSSLHRYYGGSRGHGRSGQPSYELLPTGTKQDTCNAPFEREGRIDRNGSTAKPLVERSNRFDKPSWT